MSLDRFGTGCGADPRVLTVDEADQIEEGDPAYLEMRVSAWPDKAHFTGWTLSAGCMQVMKTRPFESDWVYRFCSIVRRDGRKRLDYLTPLYVSVYGNEWRLWSDKPDNKTMEETPWE